MRNRKISIALVVLYLALLLGYCHREKPRAIDSLTVDEVVYSQSTLLADVTVIWDPNTEPDVVSYTLFYGRQSQNYTGRVDTATNLAVARELVAGATYFFVASATNIDGVESELSVEISYVVPLIPPRPHATPTPSPRPPHPPTPTPTPAPRPSAHPTPTPRPFASPEATPL